MSHWQIVDNYFRNNNVSGAISYLSGFLSANDSQRFACIPEISFTNPPSSVLAELNRFIEANENQFDVKVVYLEMNGFDINHERWYFDLFAYSSYSENIDDTEWLCNWQSDQWPEVDLTGMTSAQEAFAWYHNERIWKSQPELKPVYEASMLLIAAKFAQLIGTALEAGHLFKAIPVLATAHGFESLVRYEP